jgi:alanine dehydrogenase|uniref:Alanine dehydrogenase n=1 Tax=uncultured bacterium A1Q1_fos_2107 TaxID=1256562 RepID=L7VQ17_9BACT|nr:alanine dehydrogenase [uncultured bacterium A1Q1_fos_2107]
MRVGVPREIKNAERRVGLTPASVRELVAHGHEVVVERHAGVGIGASDADYAAAGATLHNTAAEVFAAADMIVKVKEPQASERAMLRPGQVLFTYLHLAPDPDQTADLVASGAVCIAYETVTDSQGGLPLLAPMSQVAGRMSIQAGAHCLESAQGGAGVLLGGVPGVAPGKVVVIGGGVVGENAIQMAVGLDADVTVLDRDVTVLDRLSRRFGSTLRTQYSTRTALDDLVVNADLVIGAVLVKGSRAPHLVTADMVRAMRAGSVLVDVAIDQGGCFETSHATTHDDPTYVVDDVVHYCVANMPGAVPHTSTHALNNVTLPFVLALADQGATAALLANPHLLGGLNVCRGLVTESAVAEALGYEYVPPVDALAR